MNPNIVWGFCERIVDDAEDICSLAEALQTVGNEKLSKRLKEIADRLCKTSRLLREHQDTVINERFREAQQSSLNLIRTALAAPDIGEK